MTLYSYALVYRYEQKTQLICTELNGFKETPKTYTRNSGWPRVIKKSEMNIVNTFDMRLYLKEADSRKAAELFSKAISAQEAELEKKLADKRILNQKLQSFSQNGGLIETDGVKSIINLHTV